MKNNNKKGFTLVELVIVVAVMAILVAVAIPTISSISRSAQDSVNKSNARTLESVIKLEEAELSETAGTLNATAIDKAVTEAKLGIESGTYVYDSVAGTVTYGGSASGTTQFAITFDASGTVNTNPATDTTVTVTAGSSTPVTPEG